MIKKITQIAVATSGNNNAVIVALTEDGSVYTNGCLNGNGQTNWSQVPPIVANEDYIIPKDNGGAILADVIPIKYTVK